MRTFEVPVRAVSFWLAVVIPPVGFWTLVQVFAVAAGEGTMSPPQVACLIALANGLPLAALVWMVCSVVAYTVAPGRLVVHRVVGDREYALGPHAEVALLRNGRILVRLPGKSLRLRVNEPQVCFDLLRQEEG